MRPLTKRENDVVRLLVQGKKNKEIAVEMGISVRTVATFMGRILDKTRSESRTQVVLWALRDRGKTI